MIQTSYYAVAGKIPQDVVKVGISRGIPSWFNGESYNKLAPKWETVKKYKDGGSWEDYVKEYTETVLNSLDVMQVYGELTSRFGDKIVLLCYEKSGDNCHRNIVAEWFMNAGIYCMEYAF